MGRRREEEGQEKEKEKEEDGVEGDGFFFVQIFTVPEPL